ncbi:hypothetical protein BKA65DRAFT_483288 [Rhexocercosporidium sp. MPI-PUGE-AT-0058]|nr:hypothetical protein BKA65DRAFT_483288 [Rhexocercosporidium sp. MPI-PUGE-AT-0058]
MKYPTSISLCFLALAALSASTDSPAGLKEISASSTSVPTPQRNDDTPFIALPPNDPVQPNNFTVHKGGRGGRGSRGGGTTSGAGPRISSASRYTALDIGLLGIFLMTAVMLVRV